jgi:hypothetical protein
MVSLKNKAANIFQIVPIILFYFFFYRFNMNLLKYFNFENLSYTMSYD